LTPAARIKSIQDCPSRQKRSLATIEPIASGHCAGRAIEVRDARLLRCYPVSTRINHVANDDEECSCVLAPNLPISGAGSNRDATPSKALTRECFPGRAQKAIALQLQPSSIERFHPFLRIPVRRSTPLRISMAEIPRASPCQPQYRQMAWYVLVRTCSSRGSTAEDSSANASFLPQYTHRNTTTHQ
jgi:hypothetical protein